MNRRGFLSWVGCAATALAVGPHEELPRRVLVQSPGLPRRLVSIDALLKEHYRREALIRLVGCELDARYVDIAESRIASVRGLR